MEECEPIKDLLQIQTLKELLLLGAILSHANRPTLPFPQLLAAASNLYHFVKDNRQHLPVLSDHQVAKLGQLLFPHGRQDQVHARKHFHEATTLLATLQKNGR